LDYHFPLNPIFGFGGGGGVEFSLFLKYLDAGKIRELNTMKYILSKS
jgi:hypothetical protein